MGYDDWKAAADARREAWKSIVPEGENEEWLIQKFTVEENSFGRFRYALQGRDVPPGTYTRLIWKKGSQFDGPMMSDTPAEMRDSIGFDHVLARPRTTRVLIHGLGLGCTLNLALRFPHVQHIDVVEISPELVELVGPSFTDPRVHIHIGDALEYKFPPGTRWNAVWHDIWPAICADNLPEMSALKRRYGTRTDWQGVWAEDYLR